MTKKRGQAESVKEKVSRVYGHSFVIRHAAGKKRCQKRWYGYVYRTGDGLVGRCPLTKTNHKCRRDIDHGTFRLRFGYYDHVCECGHKFYPNLHTEVVDIPNINEVIEEVKKEVRPQLEKIVASRKVKRRPKYPVKPKENK